MIPAGVLERLIAHVEAVLAAASVPAGQRDEIAEELLGHLVERVRALIADGMAPSDAADRAIRSFGTAGRIGRDFTRTYRGRLWASTIGMLLPVETPAGRRPMAVTLFWLLALGMSVVYLLMTAWAVTHHPPVRALLLCVGGAAISGAMLLVALGLQRAQRWALDIATAGSVVVVIFGLYELTRGTISLSGFLALAALLAYANDPSRVLGWLAPTAEPRGAIVVAALAIALPLLQPVATDLPDPTQAGPDDLSMSAWMDCAEEEPGGGTVTVELTWARTSLWPGGIARLDRFGDALVLELNPELASPHGSTHLVDTGNGAVVAEAGQFTAAADPMLMQLSGPSVIGIDHGRLEPGRSYRATWTFDAWSGTDVSNLQAGIEYWHADRFRTETVIMCDRTIHDWWTVLDPIPSTRE